MANKYFKDYMTYSFAERKAIIGLLILLAVLLLGIKLTDYFGNKVATNFTEFRKEVAMMNQASSNDSSTEPMYDEINTPESNLFLFNPNVSTDDEYQQMGLSKKQIGVIRNYLAKGGKFRNKEDFRKMYCISNDEYERLSPYISIPRQTDSTKKTLDKARPIYTPKSDITLELNSADTVTLTQLHGIGTAYARRIIKYRDLLGGFINKQQLFEVYSFDSLHYNQIENHVTVNPLLVKKININQASFDDLKRHPYIKTVIANAIINYRKTHGNYKEVADLTKLVLMDNGLFVKLAPYLTVN